MPLSVLPKKPLVEGGTDKRVIPYLMEANGVVWERGEGPVVHIDETGGIDQLLSPGTIEAELRASGLDALGAIVDANGDAGARWQQIRLRFSGQFPSLPDDIPEVGLNVVHADGPRFGLWIMPDNRFSGMLEDFLTRLIPDESTALYELAQDCVAEATKRGAPFRKVHETKAHIHTWLAWQNEPGKQLHHAVHHRALDPTKAESHTFVRWFRDLFLV